MAVNKINETDSLNDGRLKLNESIEQSNQAINKANLADLKSTNAVNTSQAAETKAESVQEQFNQVVINGDSSVEAAQARVNADGTPFTTLKERLDTSDAQLADTEQNAFYQSLVNKKKQGKYITLIDDDGQRGVYTKIAPLLREYGIKMTSAVITNRGHGFPIEGLPAHNSTYMSYSEMKEMENEGIVEFVCHSHTHDVNYRYTDMTTGEIHADMKQNKEIIRKLGWNYRNIVFPFGAINSNVTDVARQYFESGFDISGGVFQSPIDQFRMPRFGIDSKTFDDVKVVIDEAFEKDTWIVLMSHVDQYGGLDMSILRQIIEYALSKGMEFITVKEGVDRFGNLAQFGTETIDRKGDVFGKILGRLKMAGLDYTPNAPMISFDVSRMTILKVRSMDADSYNLHTNTGYTGLYGNIHVYRDTENAFSYQKFISTNPNKKVELLRAWNSSNSSWSDWVDTSGGSYYAGLTEFATNAPVTAYPKGKVTRLKIREADSASFGVSGYGEIRIYRDTEDVYSFREYVNVKNNSHLRSVWNSASSVWGAWESTVKQLPNLSRTVTVTIPAQSTHDIPTDTSSVSQNHNHVVTPIGTVPTGVIWSCYVPNDGRVTIRLANMTGASVTLTDVVFKILRTAV